MKVQILKTTAVMSLILAGALAALSPSAQARGAADAAASPDPAALPAAPQPVAAAQQSLEMIQLEPPKLGKYGQVKVAEEAPSRKKWIALSVALHSAAAFDAYTTRQAIGRGAVEADPFMRPFAGSPAIYVAIQAAPIAMDFMARHMQRSRFSLIRKMWWVPQASGTAMYLFSGVHNLGVAGRP